MIQIRKLFVLALLACWLPAGAETPAPEPGAQGQAAPAEAGEEKPEREIHGYAGIVQKVMTQGLLVRRAGVPSDPVAPALMLFTGRLGVPVEGEGKRNWMDLRRGDIVLVSYAKGPPHEAQKVNVLPRPRPNLAYATPGPSIPPSERSRQRSFLGFIKKIEGDELIVMNPGPPPPAVELKEIKAFVRTADTKVELLRDSWDELRKGDRVKMLFQKGKPRPIDAVQVIRKGGEEPMARGLPTRLFDPAYDTSIEDVDGIGETGPVPQIERRDRSMRIKRRRPRDP